MGLRGARTRIVKCVFESENLQAWQIQPNGSALTNQQTYASDLPLFYNSGSNYNAVTYACTFPLNFLYTSPGNYRYVAQLYDFVKLSKVCVKLTSLIDPARAVQTGATSGVYNFSAYPLQDPVITWIDYDGWSPMPIVGGTGVVTAPANGDLTQYVYNKQGARRHRPWGTIKRTFVPKVINLVASDGTTPSGSPVAIAGKRAGWFTQGNASAFTGQLMIAIPYLGQDSNTHVNIQPVAVYSILCKWFVHFKAPLYG